MLKVLRGKETVSQSCALLLGGFDGFHIGHETLLERANTTGLPVGLTTISGGKQGGDLFTFPEREEIFKRLGFSFVWEIEFSESFRNTTAEDFLSALFRMIDAKAIFCGKDFRFGKDALGTPELLEKLAPCPVAALPLKTEGNEKIATGTVKKLLTAGDLQRVNRILSGGFFVRGIVERGRGVGHTYGFPTLNLSYPKEKFALKQGVYSGTVKTDEGVFPAIVNFGARPTFGVDERKAEAYLKGFQGDLYGKTVEIYPRRFLREIQTFPSQEALKEQLGRDVMSLEEEYDQIRTER